MKILLVDDHAVLRAGLRQLLVAMIAAELREAASSTEALAVLTEWRPDIVILDLELPGAGGLSLLEDLRTTGLRVLVLSMHAEPLYATRALAAGALGYVSKNVAPEALVAAVRQIAAGERHIEPRIAQAIALQRIEAGDKLHQLTPRDLEILRQMAAGGSLREIAGSLGVTYKTVANTVSLIRAKLGVSRTADLIRLAIAAGPERVP